MTSLASLTAAANVDCAGPAEGAPFAIQTPGNSPFTFLNGFFQVNWQTKELPEGCYSLLLTLDDGTTRSTLVQLR
jgi:hypothetical protein